MGLAGAAGVLPRSAFSQRKAPSDFYEVPAFGNARILHFTDCHAQLLPTYFREPSVNLGVGDGYGKAPQPQEKIIYRGIYSVGVCSLDL